MDQSYSCQIKFEFSLSVVLTVVDIAAQLFLTVLFKIKGTDFIIKAFLYLFGCCLTVAATLLLIASAATSNSCLRLWLADASMSISSGSLVWKLFSMLFIGLHWIIFRKGYYWDFMERKVIVQVKSNQERLLCSFPDAIRTSGSVETGLKAQLEGDVMYETIREERRLETDEQQTYEYISLQMDDAIQSLQKNVAYEVVDLKSSIQSLQKNVAYEVVDLKSSIQTVELQENVAYEKLDNI